MFDKVISVISHVDAILKLLDSFQEGSIVLPAGKNVIEILTRRQPSKVWVSMKDQNNMPVCHGDLNKMSYTILPNGFVLYGDVVSDYLQVDWHVDFDEEKINL